jgi:hypothetical protein
MSLNIKNREVENLLGEVAALTGVNKTEALRQALEERKRQVIKTDRRTKLKNLLVRFLEYARVVDTLKFFAMEEIAGQLSELKLRPYTRKKWKRMVEVYGTSSGK